MKFIPLHKPYFGIQEIKNAVRVIKSGKIVGNGIMGNKAENLLRKKLNVKYVFLTTSCTHALELALMSCGVGPGDEVICPSFTFLSLANAIVLQGARRKFVDIEIETYNLSPQEIKKPISSKTKAIMVVHYAGHSSRMDEIMKIARERNIRVIEDAAHPLGSKCKNKFLGTIGDIGCFSFHNTKNLTWGEGGAIVTNSDKLAEKIEIIREKGPNRSAFIRGEVDKYTWVYKRSSYVLSDILAAIIYEQIKKLEKIMQLRKEKASYYNKKLEHLKNMLIIPQVKPECDMCWHIYAIRVDPRMRDIVLNELKRKKIDAAFHFIPLHYSPYGKQILGRRNPRLPITDLVSSYPFTNISSADTKKQNYIVDSLHTIFKKLSRKNA